IKRILEEQGIASDFKIIPINQGGLEAMIAIRKALTDGEYVCFNGDRFYEEATAIAHSLMGREARFPSGPFRIAARCRVPVVFYYAMREKGRCYRFHFEEVPAEELRSAEAILNRYTSSLERLMERYPRQWFNFYKFWN
ncbi:MAG: acyltransferase, partial [Alistipes sp.]|nr:acyltransferase [Alistipes sp.]